MKKAWLVALFLGAHFFAFSQTTESSCSDGVDNDGDGFIDCFDGDCANVAACNDSYIGKDKACQTTPPAASKFQMTLKKKSPNVTTTHGRFAVGDMGGPGGKDGVPEVVTVHAGTGRFYILNGTDMSIKHSADVDGTPERYDIAIGNVNNDGCAEAFFVETHDGKFWISSYDCQANEVWSVEAYGRPFTLGLADLDHDGRTELFYKNEILDAVTGQRLVKGTGDWLAMDSGPVAVDMMDDAACADCAGLEIVLGGEIYSVKLPTTRTGADTDAGTMTVVKRFNDIPTLGTLRYFPKAINLGGASFVNSQTSIADFNLDEKLDVLMTGASSTSTTDPITVFFWDVANNTFKTYQPKQSDNTGWVYGAGRLNIADIDGDYKMNVAFVSGNRLFVLNENLEIDKIQKKGTNIDSVDWIKTISEVSSGFTSTTVFDFNNDNASEIVYRDEDNVYIFNGKTGVASAPVACESLTTNDYPIVTDVDADGSTEICVVCEDGSGSNAGSIKTYKSALEPWVSARKVWNQHGYFNVNVNDDLTIPRFQQKHHLSFSNNICTPGQPNRALNSFLNQSAILDSKGCKTYPTADILFEPSPLLINVTQPTCPDKDFKVSFSLKNSGDVALTGSIPITFYSGDPRLAGATKLNTVNVAVTNFKPGDIISQSNITVNGTGLTFTLYAVLNDAGTTVPTPIVLPNSGFLECNYTNNVASAGIKSKDFALSTTSTPHTQCSPSGSPANGSAKAFKLVGATQQTVGYKFYWFDGATAGPTGSAAYVGANRSPLLNGTYSVYAIHDAFQCGSDTVQVTVGLQTRTINANIAVQHNFTDCEDPDGRLRVTPTTGNANNDYTYKWFQGTVFGTSPILSTSRTLDDVRGLTYSVLITEKATGCETIATGTVPDDTDKPDVTATATAANCSPANSGSVVASVPGQNNNDYDFRWYNGTTVKASPDHTNRTYSNRPAGFYTVTAEDEDTGCISDPFTIEVAAPPTFAVTGVVTSHETSCAAPNGAVSANINGSTAGYTFKWFTGNNTTPANQIATTATKNLLTAGQYTVEATHTATGCKDTDLVTINLNKQIPTVNASTLSDQSNCTPANGSVTASASNAPGPFQFYWYNGTVGTPDTTASNFKGTTYSGRTAGNYTVVAVDKISRCASTKAVVPVANTTVIPTITTAAVDQTSCNAAAPNGSASANVGGVTAGFKFRWFSGSDTTTFITQATSISNRAAGTYTVKAQNLTTRCFATKIVTIAQLADKPVLSLTKVDNSICSATVGFNGSVTSTITTNPNFQAGHTLIYEWKRNTVVIAGQTGSTLNNVDAANYSVIVTNANLGCVSDPKNISVGDITVAPAITTTFVGSTNCPAGTPNGSVTVTAPATGAQYRWYAGTTAGVGAILNASVANPTASALQGGAGQNYTVEVTVTATGCKATKTELLPDNSEVPVLGPLSKTDNTKCEDPRNGTASVGTVTYKGVNVNAPYSGYTFAWSNGGTTPTVSALAAGNYTLTVTKTDVGCTSAAKQVTVDHSPVLPSIVAVAVKSTNCAGGAPNGQVSVTNTAALSATAAPGIAEYRWYAGSGVGAPGTEINTGNNSFVNNLQGGPTTNFTVEVEFSGTGCKSNTSVLLTDDSKVPLLVTLTSDPNTKCENPRNGQVHLGTVTYRGTPVTMPDPNFAIVWNTGATTKDVTGLAVGNYSVTVRHIAHNCTSAPENIDVDDATVLPTIAAVARQSTNCAGGTPNGEVEVTNTAALTAAAPGGAVEYRWYAGGSVGASGSEINALNNPLVTGLQGGIANLFTVEVEFSNTGCKKDFSLPLTEDKQLPQLGVLTMDPNTKCENPRDGQAHLGTVTYRGAAIAMPNPAFSVLWNNGGTTKDITGLAVGNYSVRVTHIAHNCISDPKDVNVTDASVLPTIAAIARKSTNCAGGIPNGEVEVTNTVALAAAAPGGVVEYRWYAGSGVGAPGTEINTGNNPLVTGLQGGIANNFTVEVEFSNSGCKRDFSLPLTEDKQLPLLGVLTMDPNTKCENPRDGQAHLGTVNYRGAAITIPDPDFSVLWSNGGTTKDIAGLAVGNYSVTVTHIDDNCTSDPEDINVTDASVLPTIVAEGRASTNCSGAANGEIEVMNTAALTTAAPGGAVEYRWYAGSSVGAPGTEINTANNPLVTGLQGTPTAMFTVQVEFSNTGCTRDFSVPVTDDSEVPDLGPLTMDPNTQCVNPRNGQAHLGTVTYRGAAVTFPDAAYTITWSTGATNVEDITGLAASAVPYTVTVTHNTHGCTSAPEPIVVQDDLYDPLIELDNIVDQNSCTNTPNGVLAVTVDDTAVGGGSGTTAGYTFVWYEGTVTEAVIAGGGGVVVATTTGTPGEINLLPGNVNYTVHVIRTATGCDDTETYFLPETIVTPLVTTLSSADNTSCAAPNGQVRAHVGGVEAGYTFYWYDGNDAIDADFVVTNADFTGANDGDYLNLKRGFYTVVAEDNVTKCKSDPKIQQLVDDIDDIVINGPNVVTNPSSCAIADGSMDATVDVGGVPTTAGFTFQWFSGGPNNAVTPIDFYNPPSFLGSQGPIGAPFVLGGSPNVLGNPPGDGVAQGIYTVVVTHVASGCQKHATKFLPFVDAHTIAVTSNPSEICPYTVGDGDVALTDIGHPGTAPGGTDDTDYIINFYEGGTTAGTQLVNGHIPGAGDGTIQPVPMTNLKPGTYLLTVQETYTGNSCVVSEAITINANAKAPVVDLVSSIANTNCLPSPGDGSITISVARDPLDVVAVVPTYTVDMNPDPNTAFPTAAGQAAGNFVANALRPNFYTFTVTASTNCVTTKTYEVIDNPTPLEIVNVVPTPAEYCDALLEASAQVHIGGVEADGGADNINDYQFNWFTNIAVPASNVYSATGDNTAADGGEHFENGVNGVPAGTVFDRSYWVEVTKTGNVGGTGGLGCKSAPVKVDILDESVKPVVALTPFSNTSCAPGLPEGEIEVDVTDASTVPPAPAFVYRYTWTGPTAIAQANFNGTNNVFTNLLHGAYQLTARNNATGCETVANTTIVQNTTPIFVATVNSTPQLLCSPDGSLTVSQIDFKDRNNVTQNVTGAGLGDFTYQWFRNGTAPGNAVGGTTNVLNNGNYGGSGTIGFDDDYYVIATRNAGTPGRNCSSAPFRATIVDQRVFPVVTLTPFNNTSCSPGQPEGEIEVDVTDASVVAPVPGPAFDFSYNWTVAPTPIATATFDGTDNLFTNLLHGAYQVTVTNTTTNCPKVETITIQQNLTPIFVAQVNSLPQQLCSADGSLTVAQITFNDRNGVPQNVNTPAGLADFSFQWFRNGSAPGNAVGTGGTVLNNVTYPGIGFDDDYYVVATRTNGAPGRNCASAPFRVSIADQRVFPVVTLTPFNNTSCSPAQPEGEIEVDVTDASVVAPVPGPAFDFSYNWTVAPTPIATATFDGTDNVFTNLAHGAYQVTVTNTTTSCPKVANITVLQNLTPIFVAQVNSLPQQLCSPDGSLTVAQITFNDRNGVPQNVNTPAGLADFSFQWFRNGNAPANAVGTGGTALNNVTYPGIGFDDDYYVVATRTNGAPGRNCASAPFRMSIADQRVFPVAALTPFSNTSCSPGLPEGEIEVDVTDASVVTPVPGPAFQYSYAWTGTGTPIATANFNGVNNLFTSLLHGSYQVTVTNTTTQCQTIENTIIQQNTTPIFVATVNSLPQLLCNPDGSLTVTQINFNDRNGATQNVTGAGLGQFTYQWFRNGTNPGDAVGPTTNVLNSGTYPTIGFDDDYYVVATRNAGAPGRNCSSAPFRVAIDDQRVFPVVTLTPFDNTSCDNILFEGDIEVDVTDASVVAPTPGPAFTFTYAWTALTAGRTAPATPANPYNGVNNLFSNVQDGTYQLVATNTTTGCPTTEQTIVTKNTTPVFVSTVTATPQLLCAPDGSLQLTQVRFIDRNGTTQTVSGAGLADFEFTWFRDGTAAANQVGTLSTLLNNVNYASIGADPDYFVVARRIANGPGRNCSSAPFRAEIDDLRVLPVVNLTADPNTVCDNAFDGSLNVLVTDASTVPGPFNYNYTWTALTAGRATPVTTNPYNGNNNLFAGMQDGVYQLVVQNNQSLCTSIAAQTEVLQILPSVEILNVAKVDQRDCAPFDGSITVDASNPAHVSTTGTYSFTWTRNGSAVTTPTPSNILAQIDAGNYTVTGTKIGGTGSGCVTSPFPVAILDLLQRPAVDLLALSNFACNTSFNGEISATITEGTTPGIIAGYGYQWFRGLNTTAPADIMAGATTNAVTNLQHGDYTVRVIDTASPGLGCQTVATAPINFAETDFTTTITSTPQTLCAPTQDGSVAVVTITETIEGTTTSYTMSVPADRTRFGFQWFDEASAPITAVVNGANTLTNRLAGTYLVQVTNALGCSSTPDNAIIEDETRNPVVTLDDFLNPTICLLPETGGFLQVSADNSLNFSDYTFTWFEGTDDTGTQVVADNPTLSNIFHADPDVFTVRVTNKATNCFSLETYTFQTDTVTIRVVASSQPLTNCTANNGTLFAAVQQGNGNLYNYEWYRGLTIDGTPDFTTKEVLTAPLGIFTVIARHPVFAFCPTESDTTEVLDGRIFPDPLIEQRNPVTYCDPTNPNGVAYATVGGTDLGYSFDWYVGAVSGSPFYSGSEVTGLSAITYSVQATDLSSGCAGTQSIEIDFEPIPTPAPSVVILSHRTNCLVPDGALTATVNGNVVDYTIQWYDGDDVLATPDNVGEFYRDLDTGPYTTTATDVITKCVSAPVVTEILPFMELPEFEIETTPTYCDQDVGEARYIELNDVVLSSIVWDVNGAQLEGTIISNLPKGTFTVTATSVQQCVNSKEFTILPEILVFNGISRNGDGNNDFFEISCIEDFPNNTVKIFNRAGTLVYQTKGYNNADVIFEGTSNEGLSLMGRELPDGTYFYIIDKGDGSIPKTGYLELLRQPTN